MIQKIINYVLDSLVQRKGENIIWINYANAMIFGAISGVDFTKKQLALWKHLLTASRDGDEKVRMMHSLNMLLKVAAIGVLTLAWMFLSKWFFVEFKPFAYMDVNGNFWEAIFFIGTPMVLYAFFCGQLDWFGSADRHEDGTIVAESLPFKWVVSISAGVTEELSHRALLIYIGLISVYLSNLFFVWAVAFICMILCIFVLMKFEVKLVIAGPIMAVVLFSLIKLKGYLPENPIYLFNGFLLDFLKWTTANTFNNATFIFILMSASLLITISMKNDNDGFEMGWTEFATRVLMFTLWACYCMPLGVAAIQSMPILPTGADHNTYLLYVGAVLWSNAKFRDGHKYQGLSGMLNSYVIGLYMFYIAFTHGLLYAIVLHTMFDGILFSSEHLCQVIKNRRMVEEEI